MGTKEKPGEFDCWAKALPDEPFFLLLARDPLAPLLVRSWVEIRRLQGRGGDQANEAERCANDMVEWYGAHAGDQGEIRAARMVTMPADVSSAGAAVYEGPALLRHAFKKQKAGTDGRCAECMLPRQHPSHVQPETLARPLALTADQVIGAVVCPDNQCRAAIGSPCVRRAFGSGIDPGPHHTRRVRAQTVLSVRAARSARVAVETTGEAVTASEGD